MSETWKLGAILCSDVVGYSRLAGADLDRILARLRALRSDRPEWPRVLSEHVERKLASILAADVVDYSRFAPATQLLLGFQRARHLASEQNDKK